MEKSRFIRMPAFIMLGVIAVTGCSNLSKSANVEDVVAQGPYENDWQSLNTHADPEWFKDAKFGIYTHWGVYSVPKFGNEWYPRWMYARGFEHKRRGNYYNFHRNTYGDPVEFGYKDLVPMFKAEKFDADKWADLFEKSGARFAGPVGEHHDGFAMWDSAFTEWDAKEKGPQRDIVGELEKAVRKRGMKYIVSLHHARKWWYYETSYNLGPDVDTLNPQYAGVGKIYPPIHKAASGYNKADGEAPTDAYMQEWLDKTIEVIDQYQPDLLWFDSGLAKDKFWRGRTPEFDEYKKDFMAYYYNKADQWGTEVAVTYKNQDFPKGCAIIDIERGRMAGLTEYPWLTDTAICMKSWSYVKNPEYKSVNALVDVLIDIVSKNGCLLLNIGPHPDGSIPTEAQDLLLGMGQWLEANGEAIYGTRPWIAYGEGLADYEGGHFKESRESIYGPADIRFTTKPNTLYAILLDWPGEKVLIKSLHSNEPRLGKIKKVTLLGYKEKLQWSRDENGLQVQLPKTKFGDHAWVLKIHLAK
jgi:alpha-L-fucosidase